MSHARLMVVISHGLDSLPIICSTIAWMEHGRIVQLGPAEEMVEAYRNSVAASPPAPGVLVA
jgi:ABC-type polysaccharide/polyol phosphate transport system ATPase subunit